MINSETQITATIDWLSVTMKPEMGEWRGLHYPSAWTRTCVPMERGMLNYNRGVEYTDGRIELWHDKREEMGAHLIMGGECLRRVQIEYSTTIPEIVSFFSYCRPSRIDLVIDIKHGSLDISKLAADLSENKCSTRAIGGLHLKAVGSKGETLYVGSKGAERRLRVYDKAAESGQDYEWTRVELQVRHKMASRVMATLIAKDTSPSVIAGLINDFAKWESNRDWAVAMGGESVSMGRAEAIESNRKRWILDTVARSIANEYMDGTLDIMQSLKRRVNTFISIAEIEIVDRNREV